MGSTGRDEVEGAAARDAEEEFDAATRRLGIEVPADLRDGVLRGHVGLRARTVLLRRVDVGPDDLRSDHGARWR